MKIIEITANDAGRRLDRFLRKYLRNATLGSIYKLIRKDVKVNGRRQANSYMLCEGDKIALYLSDSDIEAMSEDLRGESGARVRRTFAIVYEDENILAVSKPFGLLTHGDSNEKKSHLANQVRDYLIEKGEYSPRSEKVFAPAPANRLDRNTTGLVLFGKNSMALKELNRMIREDRVRKFYRTIAFGDIPERMDLRGALVKDERTNRATILEPGQGGRPIETIVTPIERLHRSTYVEVELVTGRTHQIRAHLASVGHPVIGDMKYAEGAARAFNRRLSERYGLSTQLLHSYRIEFTEASGVLGYLEGKTLEAELPEDFHRILAGLEASADE